MNNIPQALSDELYGVCTDYRAEPGLGLCCNVTISAFPEAINKAAFLQCVRLPSTLSPTRQLLVDLDHACQVLLYCNVTILAISITDVANVLFVAYLCHQKLLCTLTESYNTHYVCRL